MASFSPPDPILLFLKPYKCTAEDKREKRLTHTWFGDRVVTYNLPPDKEKELFDLIHQQAFINKNPVHLIERFTDPSVMKIDLDFEFAIDTKKRIYTSEIIKDIIRVYNRIIQECIDVPIEKIKAYIFERKKGYRDKGKFKDGIHIMYPEIVIGVEIQKLIRYRFMETGYKIFDKLSLTNKKLDDVVDESIIDRNGWMMYGSCKPSREAYMLTHVYNFHLEEEDLPTDNRMLIEYLSIHNLSTKSVYQIKAGKEDLLATFQKPKNTNKDALQSPHKKSGDRFKLNLNKRSRSVGSAEDIDVVHKLVLLLSDYRAYDHKQWIEVGLCLFNIDDGLLDTWIEFSKRTPNKFQPGVCEEKWMQFQHRHGDVIGIGSLHRWAMLDDPIGYEEVKRGCLANYIEQSMNGTTFTIGKVVYEMYKYQYVCTSLKHNTWYEFRNHRWHEMEGGVELKKKLSNDVLNEYLAMNRIYLSRGMEMYGPSKQPYIDNAKKLLEVTLKLQDITFKEKVMKECMAMFYDNKFVEKLDSRPNLICFENGIYDLDTHEFRDGRPEDYCSLSTLNDFSEYDMEDEDIKEVQNFMAQVFPIARVREYVYTLLSSFLLGKNPHEKFHIWVGCHQKNTPIMMSDGLRKNVQDIQVGDHVMGDNSHPRRVLKLARGKSDMYRIKPIKGDPYVVNGDHILCLKATTIGSVTWNDKEKRYKVGWQEKDKNGYPVTKIKNFPIRCPERKIYQKRTTFYDSKEDAYQAGQEYLEQMKEKPETINNGDVIEIPVKEYLRIISKIGSRNYYGYRTGINYLKKKVDLDPYVLGYWLGDGASNQTSITTMDEEVINHFKTKMTEIGLVSKMYTKKDNKASTYYFSSGTHQGKMDRNPFLNALHKYDLRNNKHIPHEYKCNTREIREQVLAGIIDSDGHYQAHTNQYEITLKSEQLVDDIVDLSRSLGFACYKHACKKSCTNGKNGSVEGTYYRICIVGDGIENIPVLLKRKQAKPRNKNKDVLRYSIAIEKVEDDHYYGFTVDGNHRYVMGDYTVTHNCGSNGKSKLVELYTKAFGEYSGNLPISLLTQKRAGSSQASPELAQCRGQRFISMAEPDRGQRMNIGYMKELTGGDNIKARPLYKEPFDFKPQFKIVLCCNDLPKVPPDDEGSWRRIRVVKFISKFTTKPKKENEFPIDPYLADNFNRWKEAFMYVLLQHYKTAVSSDGTIKIEEPPEVTEATRDYQRIADIYVDFLDENVVKGNENDSIKLEEFHFRFKSWYTQNYGGHADNQKVFKMHMERKLGMYTSRGWMAIKFKSRYNDLDLIEGSNSDEVSVGEKIDVVDDNIDAIISANIDEVSVSSEKSNNSIKIKNTKKKSSKKDSTNDSTNDSTKDSTKDSTNDSTIKEVKKTSEKTKVEPVKMIDVNSQIEIENKPIKIGFNISDDDVSEISELSTGQKLKLNVNQKKRKPHKRLIIESDDDKEIEEKVVLQSETTNTEIHIEEESEVEVNKIDSPKNISKLKIARRKKI